MIFTIFFNLVYFMLSMVISNLPTSSGFPDAFSDGFLYVFKFLYAFDFLLPVSVLVLCLSLVLSFELAIFFWHGIHWLLRKIPFLHMS